MTGTRGQTSGTVIGDSATIDGERSAPTVTSGTAESSSPPLPSPSPPSSDADDDDADENSSLPLPLENALACPQLRDDCVISDVTDDDTGRFTNFSADNKPGIDPGNVHTDLAVDRIAGLLLPAGNERRGAEPRCDTNETGIRLYAKLSFNVYSLIVRVANLVCRTRPDIVYVGHRRYKHVDCSFMEVAIFVLITLITIDTKYTVLNITFYGYYPLVLGGTNELDMSCSCFIFILLNLTQVQYK